MEIWDGRYFPSRCWPLGDALAHPTDDFHFPLKGQEATADVWNWSGTDLAARPLSGRYRVNSGHKPDIVKTTRKTQSGRAGASDRSLRRLGFGDRALSTESMFIHIRCRLRYSLVAKELLCEK